MMRIKKVFSLSLIMTFICQNLVFCLSEEGFALRVPVNAGLRVRGTIDSPIVSNKVPALSVSIHKVNPMSEEDILKIDRIEKQGLSEEIRSLVGNLLTDKKILFISGDMGSIQGSRGDVIRMMAGYGVKLDWVFLEKSPDFKNSQAEKGLNSDFAGIEDKKEEIFYTDSRKRKYFEGAMRQAADDLASKIRLSDYSCVFVDDLFPLSLIPLIKEKCMGIKIIWVCRRDISRATPRAVTFLNEKLSGTNVATFWALNLIPEDIHAQTIHLRHGIDPLTLKNREIDEDTIKSVMRKYDINADRPYIFQLGRFGVNKNHFLSLVSFKWMIEELKKRGVSTLPQLVLAGEEPKAEDQKQAFRRLNEFCEYLGLENDVKILGLKFKRNEENNALEVNALQRGAIFAVHPPHSEALSLVVLEDELKGTPVIATNTGGLRFQTASRKYLVDFPGGESNEIREIYRDLFIGKGDFEGVMSALQILEMPEDLSKMMLSLFEMHQSRHSEYSRLSEDTKKFIESKFLVSQEVLESLLLVIWLIADKPEALSAHQSRISQMGLALKTSRSSLLRLPLKFSRLSIFQEINSEIAKEIEDHVELLGQEGESELGESGEIEEYLGMPKVRFLTGITVGIKYRYNRVENKIIFYISDDMDEREFREICWLAYGEWFSENEAGQHDYVHDFMNEKYPHLFWPGEYLSYMEQKRYIVLEEVNNKIVLDVATGPGMPGVLIADIGAKKVVCLDVSVNMLAEAEKRARQRDMGNVVFRRGSFFELLFADNHFDIVFANHAFRRNPAGLRRIALKEIRRVLKPGGKIKILDSYAIGKGSVAGWDDIEWLDELGKLGYKNQRILDKSKLNDIVLILEASKAASNADLLELPSLNEVGTFCCL